MDKITLGTIEKYLKNPLTKLIDGLSSEIKQIVKSKILEYQVEEYNRNLYQKILRENYILITAFLIIGFSIRNFIELREIRKALSN